MVEISVRYQGDLHCEATHGPSKTTLATDAPVDNQGKGESFSPTDLVATALGTCILTTMGILARRHDWNIVGATAHVTKEMVNSPIRRIGRLATTIHLPEGLSEKARQILENGAHTCPVHKSLHPEIEAPITFTYGAVSETGSA
jgi:putative redox protein